MSSNPYEPPHEELRQSDESSNTDEDLPDWAREYIPPFLAFDLQILLSVFLIWLDHHGGMEAFHIFVPLMFLIPGIAGLGLVLAVVKQSWKMVLVQTLVCLCDLFLYMAYFYNR